MRVSAKAGSCASSVRAAIAIAGRRKERFMDNLPNRRQGEYPAAARRTRNRSGWFQEITPAASRALTTRRIVIRSSSPSG
jgi:hypothetical protein